MYRVYGFFDCHDGVFWGLVYWLALPTLLFASLLGSTLVDPSIRYRVYCDVCRDGSFRYLGATGGISVA